MKNCVCSLLTLSVLHCVWYNGLASAGLCLLPLDIVFSQLYLVQRTCICRYKSDCGGAGDCRYVDSGLCEQQPGTVNIIPTCSFACGGEPPPPPYPFVVLDQPPPPPDASCPTCAETHIDCSLDPSFVASCNPTDSCEWVFQGRCEVDPTTGQKLPVCQVSCIPFGSVSG